MPYMDCWKKLCEFESSFFVNFTLPKLVSSFKNFTYKLFTIQYDTLTLITANGFSYPPTYKLPTVSGSILQNDKQHSHNTVTAR